MSFDTLGTRGAVFALVACVLFAAGLAAAFSRTGDAKKKPHPTTPHTTTTTTTTSTTKTPPTTTSTTTTSTTTTTTTTSSIRYRFAFENRADQDQMPSYGYNLID